MTRYRGTRSCPQSHYNWDATVIFFFKMRSHLTQADLKLSIQLRPWRSVYSRKKEDLESKTPGATLYRGIIISLTDRTDKHSYNRNFPQWLTNTVLRGNVLFFRNNLHIKQIWWRLDDDIQKFYLYLHNLFCKPAMFPRGWHSCTEFVDSLVIRDGETAPMVKSCHDGKRIWVWSQHLQEMPGVVALTCNSRAEKPEKRRFLGVSGQLASLV